MELGYFELHSQDIYGSDVSLINHKSYLSLKSVSILNIILETMY